MSECVHSSTNTILDGNNNADIRKIQHTYDRLWHESRAEITRGNVHTDPIPGHRSGSTRWGASLLLRPAPAVAERMEAVIARFRPLIGEQHIFYSAASLHTTIRVYEYYREPITLQDPEVQRYAEITQAVANHFPPMQIYYQGLTATQRGILAQGYPLTTTIQHFRQALRDRLTVEGLNHGPEQHYARDITHNSLCVFNGPLLNPQQTCTFIEQERTLDLGSTTVTTLDFVYYQRTANTVTPITLATIKLAGND